MVLASLIAVAVLTLTPEPGTARLSFWCLKCGDQPATDLASNILLFIPFGVGLGLYGVRLRRAAFLALACTCLIETLQFFVVPGRYASLRDILANFAGGLAGYLVGRYWRVLAKPSYAAAHIIATSSIILWLATQLFTAWAMGISPPPEPWWAQLRPDHDGYSIFTGGILELSVGTIQIRESDRLASDTTEAIRKHLLAGAPLRVVIANVERMPRVAPIAIISAGPVHDVVWWELDGRDGVYGVTVRGSLLGLWTPSVRITDAVPEARGDTIELTGSYRRGWYELRAHNRSGVVYRELRASPSMGWALFLPLPLYAFGPTVIWLTAFYLATVWCVLGYWNARSVAAGNVVVPIARMALGVLLGLFGAPILFTLPVAHWSEWLATIVGASAGWIVATMNAANAAGGDS